jgi:7-cyano-7-deazaguanine synthase in queuosine biosynthesis
MTNFKLIFNNNNIEDKTLLESINKLLVKKRGSAIKIPPKKTAVILMLSGGIDSICLWYLLLTKYKLNVYPLHVYSKQKFKVGEKKAINYYEKIFKKKFPSLFHPTKYRKKDYGDTAKNKAVPFSKDINLVTANLGKRSEKNKTSHYLLIPGDYNRTYIYLSYAFGYAQQLLEEKVQTQTVFIGVVPEDRSLSREATLTAIRMSILKFCYVLGDWRWQIIAPIDDKSGFFYTRDQLISFISKAGVSIKNTWSCDRRLFKHCGVCNSCTLRKISFQKHNIKESYIFTSQLINLKKLFEKKRRQLINYVCQVGQFLVFKNQRALVKNIDIKKVYYINSNVQWKRVNKSIVLFGVNGELMELNATGSFIWQKIIDQKKAKYSLLTSQLKKKYNISEKRLKKDLIVFLETFIAKNYLVDLKN